MRSEERGAVSGAHEGKGLIQCVISLVNSRIKVPSAAMVRTPPMGVDTNGAAGLIANLDVRGKTQDVGRGMTRSVRYRTCNSIGRVEMTRDDKVCASKVACPRGAV